MKICPFKICNRCQIQKPIFAFNKHHKMADGHRHQCNACSKILSLEYRQRNLERIRAYDRERGRTAEKSAASSQYSKIWRKKHPDYANAHLLVQKAIRKGILVRSNCVICGNPQTHGHHEDYTKPLEVVWLCAAHHKQRHQQIEKEKNNGTSNT